MTSTLFLFAPYDQTGTCIQNNNNDDKGNRVCKRVYNNHRVIINVTCVSVFRKYEDALCAATGKVTVGRKAQERRIKDPLNTFHSVKRFIVRALLLNILEILENLL
jgi:molecular chaperone DnaK (HSP70)